MLSAGKKDITFQRRLQFAQMIVLVHNEQTQKSLDVAKCGFDTNENEPCKVEELVPPAELAAGTAAGARRAPAGAALPSLRPFREPRELSAEAD